MDKKKPVKEKLWIYADPSVRLPYYFIRSNAFKRIGHAAQLLYILMRMSIGDTNFNPMRVKFGPQDVEDWMSRNTYYPAIKRLVRFGIIREVEPGKSGRKAIFDLTIRNWVEVGERSELVSKLRLANLKVETRPAKRLRQIS